jgi:integrase
MNAQLKPQLMKRTIDALKPREKPYIVWDGALPGFGLRVAPSGHKSFILDYRPHGGGRAVKKRRLTIGAHGPLTANGARKAAIDALADVRRGADPQQDKVATRTALTVADLIDEFIKGHVDVKAICKASTATGYKLALERLKKAHGALKARDFTRSQLAAMHTGMGELARLGDALEQAETTGLPRKLDPYAIAAIRLLILTGGRLREIVDARWGFVDFEKGLLNLPDSKTGRRRSKCSPACRV